MLVVCIPAFNEERTIAKVVVGARKLADSVIVCDDGSSDITGEIAEALGAKVVRHKTNMGKGAALGSLFVEARKAKADVVVTIDADSQHDPSEIPKVVKPILEGTADIVIGLRPMKMGIMPRKRILGNKILDAVASQKAGAPLHDTQSGFRAYSALALERINFSESGMATESQTLIDASASGLRIAEVQISTTYEGVTSKRSGVGQLTEVLDYIVTRTVVESPLKYLGIPSLVVILLGVAAGVIVLNSFVQSHEIAIGTALVSAILIIIGTVMFATSVIVKLVKA